MRPDALHVTTPNPIIYCFSSNPQFTTTSRSSSAKAGSSIDHQHHCALQLQLRHLAPLALFYNRLTIQVGPTRGQGPFESSVRYETTPPSPDTRSGTSGFAIADSSIPPLLVHWVPSTQYGQGPTQEWGFNPKRSKALAFSCSPSEQVEQAVPSFFCHSSMAYGLMDEHRSPVPVVKSASGRRHMHPQVVCGGTGTRTRSLFRMRPDCLPYQALDRFRRLPTQPVDYAPTSRAGGRGKPP